MWYLPLLLSFAQHFLFYLFIFFFGEDVTAAQRPCFGSVISSGSGFSCGTIKPQPHHQHSSPSHESFPVAFEFKFACLHQPQNSCQRLGSRFPKRRKRRRKGEACSGSLLPSLFQLEFLFHFPSLRVSNCVWL